MDNWGNTPVQLARLLCEIRATQDLDLQELCASMDLDVHDIRELFERAHDIWETAKAAQG